MDETMTNMTNRMQLPKNVTPTYTCELPSTKQAVKYRPFLVREEKILLIALESEDDREIQNAKNVDIQSLNDRLQNNIIEQLKIDPKGILIGYKMVDGNQFGLVLRLNNGLIQWFFENELTEIDN